MINHCPHCHSHDVTDSPEYCYGELWLWATRQTQLTCFCNDCRRYYDPRHPRDNLNELLDVRGRSRFRTRKRRCTPRVS